MLTTLEVIDILQEIKYSYGRLRKWLLSEFMTKREIVSTALKAVLTAEEHEAREQFLYRGRKVRGILCHKCNLALGLMGDSPASLFVEALYILKGNLKCSKIS